MRTKDKVDTAFYLCVRYFSLRHLSPKKRKFAKWSWGRVRSCSLVTFGTCRQEKKKQDCSLWVKKTREMLESWLYRSYISFPVFKCCSFCFKHSNLMFSSQMLIRWMTPRKYHSTYLVTLKVFFKPALPTVMKKIIL